MKIGQWVKENAKLKSMSDKIFLHGLTIPCKIGIYDWERKIKQKIVIDLEISTDIRRAALKDDIRFAVDYKKIAKHMISFVGESEFYLVETLAERLAQSILKNFRVTQILLRVSKPGAIRGSKNVGIEIVRKKKSHA